jgi:four helix bundle protein
MRAAPRDYAHFLNIAEGFLSETEYLLLVSRDLGYILSEIVRGCLAEASGLLKMLYVLRKTVQSDASTRQSYRRNARP